MRLAVVGVFAAGIVLGQSATNPPANPPAVPAPAEQAQDKLAEALKQRLAGMRLVDPKHVAVRQMALDSKPRQCAIPLLNALPAKGNADYKIRTIKPPAEIEHHEASRPPLGIPACAPGLFSLGVTKR